jgi:hypothetical protein
MRFIRNLNICISGFYDMSYIFTLSSEIKYDNCSGAGSQPPVGHEFIWRACVGSTSFLADLFLTEQ